MNPAGHSNRDRELANRALDDELTSEEGAEFAASLARHPELLQSLQRELVLWELWSQEHAPERSTTAFMQSWETRVQAEESAQAFVDDVAAKTQGSNRWRFLAARQWVRRWTWPALLKPVLVLASVVAIMSMALLVLTKPAHAVQTLTGEAVCRACQLKENHAHNAALRVRDNTKSTTIYYLDPDNAIPRTWGNFCAGPVPVQVTGRVTRTNGQFFLTAEQVTAAEATKP